MVALRSGAAVGSLELSKEIGMSVRWPETILRHTLNNDQKTRSVRLLGTLKAAFLEVSLMIQAFCKGLQVEGTDAVSITMLSNTSCGFEFVTELLRQLAQQFSLSGAEALSMRSELLSRIFATRGGETSTATRVIGRLILKLQGFPICLGHFRLAWIGKACR